LTDPSGEIAPWLMAAGIGAAVNLGADYLVTTYIEHEEYTWRRAAIAAGTGALSGLTGVGIGAIVSRAGMGATAAFATRMIANSAANAAINALQRSLNEECTTFRDVGWDLFMGGLSSASGDAMGRVIQPARVRMNPYATPDIPNLRFPSIRMNPFRPGGWAGSQGFKLFDDIPRSLQATWALLSGLALGLSDASLLDAIDTLLTEPIEEVE